ncbi:hypothetical protein SAMN05444394_2753 [Algoriphagus halophilus]|uniref:Uncharacterized protein n=1 Tax=Algoriphagus halophilus TaxID=226505 RepID=A0A1N6FVB7_9BACT|nr:hypothetical protein SAMN05444394_2753 [Algoriphagus halophilus]
MNWMGFVLPLYYSYKSPTVWNLVDEISPFNRITNSIEYEGVISI